jgi:hypothetical protein
MREVCCRVLDKEKEASGFGEVLVGLTFVWSSPPQFSGYQRTRLR